jgi:recombination protein RecR
MDSIKRLKDLFAKFPAVGPKMASRFVFHVVHSSPADIQELITAIQAVKNNITLCQLCFQPFEAQGQPTCQICNDPGRNKQLLCIVEKENDLISIENTKKYKGLYFVLGNTLLTLRKINDQDLRIAPLKERIKNSQFTEIIIATNPTIEGRAASTLVEMALKELPQFPTFKITHLATGMPVGGELEYADEETLDSAFEGRK